MVQHSSEWPRNGQFLSSGSKSYLRIKPTMYSTSPDVEKLEPIKRQCYYKVRFDSDLILL